MKLRILLKILQWSHLPLAVEGTGTIFSRKNMEPKEGIAPIFPKVCCQLTNVYELPVFAIASVEEDGEVKIMYMEQE